MDEPDLTRELVERAQHGDRAAADDLMRKAVPELHAYVRMRLGARLRTHEESFDLVQSACREVLADLGDFRYEGAGSFKHWLATAALRKIVDRADYWTARKRDIAREAAIPKDATHDPIQNLADVYGSFVSPSKRLIGKEVLERIEAEIEKLPPDYKEALFLSRVLGLSRAEIATRMKKTEASVRNLVSRALALLAEALSRAD